MLKKSFRLPLLLVLTLILSACGFTLGLRYPVADELKQVELTLPGGLTQIRQPLNNLLRINGIEIKKGAPYRIEILSEGVHQRNLTLQLDRDAIEYELRAQVFFRVFGPDGKLVIGERRIDAIRTFDRIENNTSASDVLRDQLKREMFRTLAEKVVRQYTAIGHPAINEAQ